MKKNENLSFEESLKKLEDAVARLRRGDCSLEESIKVYEQSVEYYELCNKILEDARQKIEIYNPAFKALEDFKDA